MCQRIKSHGQISRKCYVKEEFLIRYDHVLGSAGI